MSRATFLQLHTLTSYPGTLLNRDDAGFAKRLPFGGTTRTRVSSQCLKYHWRNFDGENALYGIDDAPRSLRSRETFQRRVAKPLIDEGHPAGLVRAATLVLRELALNGKAPGKKAVKDIINPDDESEAWDSLETSQITIFGAPELRYLRKIAGELIEKVRSEGTLNTFWDEAEEPDADAISEAVDLIHDVSSSDLKKNLKGMRIASGLDAAMFGRMTTSDILARGDAAVHVAHAFTTHAEESESDYFSAVDELRRDEPEDSGELGAGHINSQELTSGLFYGYVAIDVPLLVSNLEGVDRKDWQEADPKLASNVIRRFIQLVATVSPGAKLGSTAPHAYAQCLIVEAGTAQPRTFANAFQQAVPTNSHGVLANSYDALARHITEMDRMYGKNFERRLAAMGSVEGLQKALNIDECSPVSNVAEWAANQIAGN